MTTAAVPTHGIECVFCRNLTLTPCDDGLAQKKEGSHLPSFVSPGYPDKVLRLLPVLPAGTGQVFRGQAAAGALECTHLNREIRCLQVGAVSLLRCKLHGAVNSGSEVLGFNRYYTIVISPDRQNIFRGRFRCIF